VFVFPCRLLTTANRGKGRRMLGGKSVLNNAFLFQGGEKLLLPHDASPVLS